MNYKRKEENKNKLLGYVTKLENCQNYECQKTEAWFKRRTYHVPNLIKGIKYMMSSTFETIKFDDFN